MDKNILVENKDNTLKKVNFYWLHNILVLITFLTIIIFWWNVYPLNNLDFMPDNKWNLFSYFLFLNEIYSVLVERFLCTYDIKKTIVFTIKKVSS